MELFLDVNDDGEDLQKNKQNMWHVKTHQVHTRSIKGLVPKYSCTKIREKKSSYPFHTQYLP